MLSQVCLLAAVFGGVLSTPQFYGLPSFAPAPTSYFKTIDIQLNPTPTVLSDFTSQTGQFLAPSNPPRTSSRTLFNNPSFSTNNFFNKVVESPQTINPDFQTGPALQRNQFSSTSFQQGSTFQKNQFSSPNFQTGSNFQRNQFSSPNIQTSNVVQSDFPQTQSSNFNQFNRPPVRSGIQNHPFLHGNSLELLPPLQHVVGTKYPRVEAGAGFRFPTSQLLNTTPPPNLL